MPQASAWQRRILLTAGFGLGGALVGGGLSLILGVCTTCGSGRDPPVFAALFGIVAALSAWGAGQE